MPTTSAGQDVEAIASLVGEISALADHARLHGPAPECSATMDALVEKHRARIEAARRVEGEEPVRQDDGT